jgi:ATP-dependent Lhr-like helicase
MVAYVRRSAQPTSVVPHWSGARMPISPELAASVRERLDEARRGIYHGPEMEAVRPILELQATWSRLPAPDELLVERVVTREGHHLFFYPVEGRLVHEGLAALFAIASRFGPISFTRRQRLWPRAPSADPAPIDQAIEAGLFSPANLLHDIPASLNAAELARRQFREIARVAGLIFQGYPGVNKSMKQVQASSELLYDVFARYDPQNLLLLQAHREVLERQLEQSRLAQALARVTAGRITVVDVERPTPWLSHSSWIAREQVSSEKFGDRSDAWWRRSSGLRTRPASPAAEPRLPSGG